MFDLDGTLLNGSERPSEGTLCALQDAREAGYALAVCSGRCWGLIPKVLVRQHVMDYYVCSNGSTVLDAKGTPLLRNAMDEGQCREALAALEDLRPGWNCFTGPAAFAEPRAASYMMRPMPTPERRSLASTVGNALRRVAFAVGGVGFRPMPSMRFVLRLWHHGLEKMGASFADEEACEEAVRRLEALGRFEVIKMGQTEIEVTEAGTTKGTGADWLLNHLSLPRDSATAFGDSENDLPLLGHVGHFVAMGNATPAVKAQADEVCGPVSEDGVATWLEYFLRQDHSQVLGPGATRT